MLRFPFKPAAEISRSGVISGKFCLRPARVLQRPLAVLTFIRLRGARASAGLPDPRRFRLKR